MPYIQNALSFVTDTILSLYLLIIILRFIFQQFQVDFRNPVSRMVILLTNKPLNIVRQFIPSLFGIDMACVLLVVVVGVVKTSLLMTLSLIPYSFPGALVFAISEILKTTIWVLIISILASAVLSWLTIRSYHPIIGLVSQISEPVLRPFRRLLPAMGGIDFSPLLALVVLNLLLRLTVQPLTDFGRYLILS